MNETTESTKELAVVNPADLYRIATNVAGVCGDIVKKTAVEIKGKKYVKVEGWEAIAAAHGCCAGADSAERAYASDGAQIGYQAKGYIRNSRGEIIGTGDGFVGFDELDKYGKQTWGSRPEYAGRAMAQTRAISRAARAVFAHVVVLIDAGLSTTPAEEVPLGGFDNERIEERQEAREKEAATASRGLEKVEQNPTNWQDYVLHFSKNKGKRLAELSQKQLHWYAHDWADKKLAEVAEGKEIRKDDAALIKALMEYRRESEAFRAKQEMDQREYEEEKIPF